MFFLGKKKSVTKKNKLPEKLVLLNNVDYPAWVWDAEYRLIVWANVQGLKFWGVENRNEIKELLFPETHDMVVSCDAVYKKIVQGKLIQKSLNFMVDSGVQPHNCTMEAQILPDERFGILISVVDVKQKNKLVSQNEQDLVPVTDQITENMPSYNHATSKKQHEVSHRVSHSLEINQSNNSHNNKSVQKDDIMLSKPITFTCDQFSMIVGFDEIFGNVMDLKYGDPSILIFKDRRLGKNIIGNALSTQQSANVYKLDIGFGVKPYLIQTTKFEQNGLHHFNMGILRLTEEKFSELSSNVKSVHKQQEIKSNVAVKNHQKSEALQVNEAIYQDFDKEIQSSSVINDLMLIDVAIFEVNNKGKIVMLNEKALQLLGKIRQDLVGDNIMHFFSNDAKPVLSELIENGNKNVLDDLSDGVICEYINSEQKENSAKLIVRYNQAKDSYWFILDDRTEVEQMKSDIVSLKTMTRDIASKNGQVSIMTHDSGVPHFVNGVSHEIRAPLNAISGYAEMIEKEVFGKLDDARYKEYAAYIRGGAEYALSIVNELLDYSKLKSGGFIPSFEEVNVGQVIDEAIQLVYPQANMRKIEIVQTVLNNIPAINADKRLLKQVFINILTNSIKYSNDEEQVLLTAGPTKSGRVMIEVTDFGRGMSSEEITRALTPFASDHNLSDYPSSGLGLSLSNELTELMNGRLTINSIVGEKTRVRLVFEKSNLPDT